MELDYFFVNSKKLAAMNEKESKREKDFHIQPN